MWGPDGGLKTRGGGRRRAAAALTVVDGGAGDGGGWRWRREGLSARRTKGGGEDEGLCSTKTKELFRSRVPAVYIGAKTKEPVIGYS